MFEALARRISSRWVAAAVVLIALAVAAVSLLFARRVVQNDDLLAFLPASNREVAAFTDINRRFGGLDVGLIGIEAKGDVFDPDFLRRLERVTRDLKETPGLSHVMSLSNMVDFAPDKEHGGIVTGHLVSAIPRDAAEREALRQKVMSRDLLVGNLVSADGKAVLVYTYFAYGTDAKATCARAQQLVKSAFPGEKVTWGGNPFISTYSYLSAQDDMRRLTPWAALAIVLIMMIAFRDVTATLLALVSTGIGMVFSLGMMGAFGVPFTIVLGSMPIVMLALGSAYAIHVLARYYSLAEDCDCETAVARTIVGVGPTVVAAGLTTVFSLLSFLCMDIQPMRVFGLFTAIGLAAKLVLSITFIPAVVRLLNLKRRPAAQVALRRGMGHLSGFARGHRWAVSVPLLLIAAVGLFMAFRVDRRLDMTALYSPGSPPDLAQRAMKERFGGSQFLQIQLKGDMNDPQVLREMQRMGDEISLQPHVTAVSHYGQAMAQINAAMTGLRRIPDTSDQVKLLFSFLMGDPSIKQLVSDDRREALMQVKLDVVSAAETEPVLNAIEAWAARQPLAFQVQRRTDRPAARQRELVAIHVLAAAHQARVAVDDQTRALLHQEINKAPPTPSVAALEQTMLRFLRGGEVTVQLPQPGPGEEDPARKVAAALVRLGRVPTDTAVAGAIAAALSEAVDNNTVQDLAASVATPLRESWALEQASAHAARLLAATRLQIPAGAAGDTFKTALPAALLDLEAPSYFAPQARAGGTSADQLAMVVTGMPVMNRGLSDSVMKNQMRSFFFAGLVVLVVMSILFRSLWSGLLGMVPASLTTLCIYGTMGIMGVHLDIGTSMLGAIIIGAGVDYAIHLIGAWHVPRGGDPRQAAFQAADRAGLGIWTNAVMVAAGFFILTLGDSRPLKTVGALTAAAMLVAAVCTFFAIPVLARRQSYRHSAEVEPSGSAAVEVGALHSPADR